MDTFFHNFLILTVWILPYGYVKTGCKIKGKCRFIKFLFAFYRLVCSNKGQIALYWVDIARILAV